MPLCNRSKRSDRTCRPAVASGLNSSLVWLALTVVLALSACRNAAAHGPSSNPVRGTNGLLGASLEELNDDSERLDIQDVRHEPLASQFRLQVAGEVQRVTRCRWYRFTLDPTSGRSGTLVIAGAELASATLFEPTRLGYRAERFGGDTPVAARRLQNGYTDIDLLPTDYGRLLYLRVVAPKNARLKIEERAKIDARETLADLRGMFFGTVYVILMVAAFIFALITRVPAFSYYGIYMTMQALEKFANLPFAKRSLWPQIATPELLISIIYVVVASLSLNEFFRFALETRKSRLFDRILIFNAWGGAITGVVCVCLDDYNGTFYSAFILAPFWFASLAATAAIAFVRWRQHYVSAGIYLIGIAGVAVGLGVYPFVRVLTPDLGFVWEAVAFLAAIAYRLVVVTNDRENAMAETLAAKEAVTREYALRLETIEGFNSAFSRFVPREFLEQLGRKDVREVTLGDHVERDMNVLFCDIRSFVALSESLEPQATFDFLNRYFGRVGPIVRANNGFVDQYLGDGVKALFPQSSDDALRAAISLHSEIRRFNEARAREGSHPIEIGVALHRGPVILATIGESERYDTTVVTEVVNVTARLEGLTKVYGARIIASAAVVSNLFEPEAYNLRPLGELQILGSARAISAFEVCDGDAADILLHKRATLATFATGIAAYRRGDFIMAAKAFSELVQQEPRDTVARFFAERSRRRGELGSLAWDGIDRHETKG